ncbi:hypothetical protein ACSVDE_08805 [Pseudalkalibacillus sp. Hm43]|uniref:hypothetical protein n=1 Tax=Pseudalkalibacillus sp. Hm43 TaxID=3450742 RepID=UPI003F427489
MNLLTKNASTELELINRALNNEGLNGLSDKSQIHRLGEGAWHFAYLVEKDSLVLRIPKKTAYDQEVVFNRDELTTEFAGTKAFYEMANKAKKGICPEHFEYFVHDELTYTIESYLGTSAGLGDQTEEQAKRYGAELGEFFLALEGLEHPYDGIGYLKVGDSGNVKGSLDMDLKACIIEETQEYLDDLNTLASNNYRFDKEKVLNIGKELLSKRSVEREKKVLTNQDTSPENILFTSSGARMIDPVPILYTGTSLAANYVYNYQGFFHTVHDTERYGKCQYHLHIPRLKANAEGFIAGYTNGSPQKLQDLNVEVFIKLLSMAFTHHELLQKDELSHEQIIRFGTKEQIEKRLQIYLRELEAFTTI